MNTTQRAGLLQRWTVVQEELIPELDREVEGLTPRLEKLIHTLEWARIEDFVPVWHGVGRPPADRSALANSFVAKAVLELTTTVALIGACERPAEPAKRGRPRHGETREPKLTRIEQQRRQTLAQMQDDLPRACDRGTKCNAQGYKVSWNGYKLHIDTADCGVPVAATLSSASMHDSQAASPCRT